MQVIGEIRAILPKQRPGRKADLIILKAAEIYGELRNGREKRKRWGLAFGGVEGLPGVRAPADGFSAADQLEKPALSVERIAYRRATIGVII